MTPPEEPPAAPPRRRAPWSFKNLVQDVSGRPLSDFQDPPPRAHAPPGSPSPAARTGERRAGASGAPSPYRSDDPSAVPIPAAAADAMLEAPEDPVARIYPPLSGSTARALHGADAEHHAPTLRSVEDPREPLGPGDRRHPPGPSHRPERIYLHYLLLHLDRLNDGGLRYLKHAVDEELAHREAPRPAAAEPVPAATPVPPGPAPTSITLPKEGAPPAPALVPETEPPTAVPLSATPPTP